MKELMLRGKNIDLNHFKNDVLSDAIEEYQVYFEDTRGGKGELSKTKQFSHEKLNEWKDSIYNYF